MNTNNTPYIVDLTWYDITYNFKRCPIMLAAPHTGAYISDLTTQAKLQLSYMIRWLQLSYGKFYISEQQHSDIINS